MIANTGNDFQSQNLQGIAPSAGKYGAPCARTFPRRFRLLCGLLSLALSAYAVAQTHFCIGGDLDHLSSADVSACQAKMSGVRDAVKQRGGPADWHYVVVCDEAGWKEYASFSRQETGLLTDASYSTDPRLRWTFLRGSDLNADRPRTTASVIAMALNGVPDPKNAPIPTVSAKQRPFSIATVKHESSNSLSR